MGRFQVVVVGAGPCGVTVANHLGMYGVRTLLLERSRDILDYPRAVGADDETIRSWQTVGLAEVALADMIRNVPARYHNSRGRCFAEVRPSAQPFGWPRRNIFLQPLTEATLRKGLERYPAVTVALGCELESLDQDDAGITLQVRSDTGETASVQCDYLVGADGGRSTVRRLLGVELTGTTLAQRWLVVDVMDDTLYEPFSGIYCHPSTPHMSIDLPYGYRRYEFIVPTGESEEAIQSPARIEALMRPHYPDGKALPTIKRARVYTHHSRIAERFQVGRAFLAGDAAHLQPPFFGQGMNSGIRDATNLAWKLAAVIHEKATPRLLETYDAERRDHALAMVNIATWMGRFYRPRNRLTEMARDAFFDAIQRLPNVRDYVLQLRFKPMPRYTEGIVAHDGPTIDAGSPVGRMFMQPRVETVERKAMKLDDALGPWFAVIGINVDPATCLDDATRAFWKQLGATLVQVVKSRRGTRGLAPSLPGTVVLDDVDGAFRDWLSSNPSREVIVLRPDRYVAAACQRDRLIEITRSLAARLR